MRRLLIIPAVAVGVALSALPASADGIARVIGSFPQGTSTFEQANTSATSLIGNYSGLSAGNYRTAVYQGAGCTGTRLVSNVFTRAASGSTTTMQSLGAFDLTKAQSVGLLHWGVLVSCDKKPIVVKGGPF